MVNYIMLGFILLIIIYGAYKKVDIYEAFMEGSLEALSLFKTLFPTLLSLILAINLLQSSGVFSIVASFITHIFKWFYLPIELVGMILLRPLSGSGSLALLTQIYDVYGTEVLVSNMATLIQGATDTTFYVISLYFSTIHLKKNGYSIYLCLFLDFISIVLAIVISIYLF